MAWNPADKTEYISLSESDTRMDADIGGYPNGARTVESKSSGKWYWEIEVGEQSNNGRAGICTAAATFSDFAGQSNSWGMRPDGYAYSPGGNVDYTAVAGDDWRTAGEIGRIAFDADNGYLWLAYNNGPWWGGGDPAAGASPTFSGIPAGMYASAQIPDYGAWIRGKFTAGSQVYAAPSGFSAFTVPVPVQTNIPTLALPDTYWPITYVREVSASPLLRRIYTLTLEAAGYSDLALPMASFQSRRRNGEPTYLSVVVPNAAQYVDAITDRSAGQLVIRLGYEFPDKSRQLEEIVRVNFETIKTDKGGRSYSASLVGHATVTTVVPKVRKIYGASYRSLSDGLLRFRAKVDNALQPGDTADVNGEQFTVGEIVYAVGPRYEQMEILEA